MILNFPIDEVEVYVAVWILGQINPLGQMGFLSPFTDNSGTL